MLKMNFSSYPLLTDRNVFAEEHVNSGHYHVSQSDYFSVQTSVETLRNNRIVLL